MLSVAGKRLDLAAAMPSNAHMRSYRTPYCQPLHSKFRVFRNLILFICELTVAGFCFANYNDRSNMDEHSIYAEIPAKQSGEIFTTLLRDKNVVIQRIISDGQVTPPDKPYYQEQDEWVIVIQGQASLNVDGAGKVDLQEGDYYFIPKHTKHWVTYTSKKPKTIWLTVHVFDKPVPAGYDPD